MNKSNNIYSNDKFNAEVVAVFWDLGGHASFRREPAQNLLPPPSPEPRRIDRYIYIYICIYICI